MAANISPHHHGQRGQSLIELTVSLPLILFLLAGVVEITNLLIAQNRVSTSARIATSYATTNFREELLPLAWSETMAGVALHSVANSPQADPDLWDFAVVRATTNEHGDGFTRWDIDFPNGTPPDSVPDMDGLQEKVLSQLGTGASAGNLDLMITVAYAQYDSMLKLDAFFSAYPDRLSAINIGLVDRKREPELICAAWAADQPVPFAGVVDRHGAFIDTAVGDEHIPVSVDRISGTPSFYNYLVEHKINGGWEEIKFDEAELKRGDTDVVKLVLDPAYQVDLLQVSTKAANAPEQPVTIPVKVGATTGSDSLGFETHIIAVETTAQGLEVTLYISGTENRHDLSHVTFRFSSKVCLNWELPEDTGDYSSFVGAITP